MTKYKFEPLLLAILFSFPLSLLAQFTPFTNSNVAYQLINGDLRVLDVTTGTYGPNLIAPINGVTDPFAKLNGGVFNDEDDFIYAFQKAPITQGGIDPHHLVRISSEGEVMDLGYIGREAAMSAAVHGDDIYFNTWGQIYIVRGVSKLNEDPSATLTIDSLNFTANMQDMVAYEANGRVYLAGIHYQSAGLIRVDVANILMSTLFSIPELSSMAKQQFGAAWLDKEDRIFVAHNKTGDIYQINDYNTTMPSASFVMSASSVNINDGLSSVNSNPFALPLPIELVSFDAKPLENDVLLSWITATETNNSHFELEHSLDAVNFELLTRVEGNGTSIDAQHYTFKDLSASAGVNYYRLKQIDFDGTATYSELVSIVVNTSSNTIEIWPNPVSSQLWVNTRTVKAPVSLRIYNALGRSVQEIELTEAPDQLAIDVKALNTGIYFIAIENQRGQVVVKKIKVSK